METVLAKCGGGEGSEQRDAAAANVYYLCTLSGLWIIRWYVRMRYTYKNESISSQFECGLPALALTYRHQTVSGFHVVM